MVKTQKQPKQTKSKQSQSTKSSKQTKKRQRQQKRQRRKLKTRNKILIFAIVCVFLYASVDIVMGFMSMKIGTQFQLDSTLTEEVIEFCKWTVTTGACITVAKTIKGDTNSDEDEINISDENNENINEEDNDEG